MTLRSKNDRSCRRAGRAVLIALALAAGLSAPARATDYPDRAVHLIVPTGAGGGYDVFGRIVADQLSQRLGQAVVDHQNGRHQTEIAPARRAIL